MLNLVLPLKFELKNEWMLYCWWIADVSQCGVIIVCIYAICLSDSPSTSPNTFFVCQPLGQYACEDIIEKNQAHRDKYEKWGQSFLTSFSPHCSACHSLRPQTTHIVAYWLIVGYRLQSEPTSLACLGFKQWWWRWIIRLLHGLHTILYMYNADLTTSRMLQIRKRKFN